MRSAKKRFRSVKAMLDIFSALDGGGARSTFSVFKSSNTLFNSYNHLEVFMGLEKLISLAALLAILATSAGQLPRIICAVHMAELHLIKESQSSNWGRAMLLPASK